MNKTIVLIIVGMVGVLRYPLLPTPDPACPFQKKINLISKPDDKKD